MGLMSNMNKMIIFTDRQTDEIIALIYLDLLQHCRSRMVI